MARGIILVGGGALIRGLADLLQSQLKIPVHVAHDPLSAVVRGTGVVLENLHSFKDVLIEHSDGLPPAV